MTRVTKGLRNDNSNPQKNNNDMTENNSFSTENVHIFVTY